MYHKTAKGDFFCWNGQIVSLCKLFDSLISARHVGALQRGGIARKKMTDALQHGGGHGQSGGTYVWTTLSRSNREQSHTVNTLSETIQLLYRYKHHSSTFVPRLNTTWVSLSPLPKHITIWKLASLFALSAFITDFFWAYHPSPLPSPFSFYLTLELK